MASLLQRARQVQDRLKEKTAIDAIPLEEREKIYNEIDQAVSSNKLRIEKNTFSFTPVRSDIKLPVLINLGAFILIVGLSITFYFVFNKAETSIVSEKENVISAEGLLLQALKAESEQRLGEKEKEISSIQSRLNGMREEQQKLISSADEKARQFEENLKLEYDKELELERQRLQEEGLSTESIDQKMQEFENIKQKEFDNKFDEMKNQLETERLEREISLNNLINDYEQNLESARSARIELEDELTRKFSEKEKALETERNAAVDELNRLDEEQQEEKLVIDQILSMYTKTNELIKNRQYEEALVNLNNLETLLNKDNIIVLPAIQYRREVDFFMIQSLRRLVASEKQADIVDTDPLFESSDLISSVSGLVEEGNNYFEEGDLESARASYIKAISKVPALEGGFNNLKDIDEIDLKEDRESFLQGLTEGDRYFKSRDFKSAIEKYRQALEYFETDSDLVDRMVTQLVGAGLGLETSRGNTLISSRELTSLNEAKIEQQERENLVNELTDIERKIDVSTDSIPDSGENTSQLISLLDTKILIKEIIASDSIREEYPDLYEKMEMYLEAYGKEKERAGRDAALEEIVALTDYLSKGGGSDAFFATPEEEQQRELFLQFLQNLKGLFELGG